MPFAATCLDVVGTCGNTIPRVEIGQGVEDTILIQLVDPNPETGGPVDLTQYGITGSSSSSSSSSSLSSSSSSSSSAPKHGVEFVVKEMTTDVMPLFTKMGEVRSEEDAKAGKVYLAFTPAMTVKAGIGLGMAFVWNNGVLKKTLPFYMDILPSLYVVNNGGGPITFYEIRLSIRDTCPAINYLLDALDFQPHEMAAAIRWPIDCWNETRPIFIQKYTPMNFPYRYNWREAVIGELMRMVGTWLQRNNLDYSIAGLTVKDTARWPEYMQMGEARVSAYKTWAAETKLQENIKKGYMTQGGWRFPLYR